MQNISDISLIKKKEINKHKISEKSLQKHFQINLLIYQCNFTKQILDLLYNTYIMITVMAVFVQSSGNLFIQTQSALDIQHSLNFHLMLTIASSVIPEDCVYYRNIR